MSQIFINININCGSICHCLPFYACSYVAHAICIMSVCHLFVISDNSATFHCCSAEYLIIYRSFKEVPGKMELETTLSGGGGHGW